MLFPEQALEIADHLSRGRDVVYAVPGEDRIRWAWKAVNDQLHREGLHLKQVTPHRFDVVRSGWPMRLVTAIGPLVDAPPVAKLKFVNVNNPCGAAAEHVPVLVVEGAGWMSEDAYNELLYIPVPVNGFGPVVIRVGP